MMRKFIGAIGGRKFLVAVVGLIGVVVMATLKIDIEPYKEAIIGVAGTYLLGQGVADGLSGGKTSTTTPDESESGGES